MKKEFISELFKKFEDACYDFDGVECWSARELQDILGYSQWRNFKNVIDKAQKSCEQADEEAKNHFAEFSKMVEIGSGAQKPVEDIALTRYACYLIAHTKTMHGLQDAKPLKKVTVYYFLWLPLYKVTKEIQYT